MSGPDLTDPRDNPLIPTWEAEPAPPEQDPAHNELIPDPFGGQQGPGPDPTVGQLEGMLAKFLRSSTAADYERLKALFRL